MSALKFGSPTSKGPISVTVSDILRFEVCRSVSVKYIGKSGWNELQNTYKQLY